MKDKTYWEKRKAQRMFEAMEDAEDTAKEIAEIYAKASSFLNQRIEGVFDKFKQKHGLSEDEARKLLNDVMREDTFEEMLKALKKGVPTDKKKELLKILEAPAYRYRINRFEELQNQIDGLMENVYHQEANKNTSHYIDTAYNGYYKSMYDIQKNTGIGFSFAQIDSQHINQLLHSKWSGNNYSSRIWSNTQELVKTLKQELLVGLMMGKTEREMVEVLTRRFQVGAFQARRLVRTESCFVTVQTDLMSYEECECESYIFVATLDMDTSDICRSLDSKEFKLSEQQPGKNCPPMHPFCRSTTISDLSKDVLSKLRRRARDPITGRTYTVPATTSYEEWLKYVQEKHGHDTIKNIQIKTRNFSNDKKQYHNLIQLFGKENIANSLEKFQEIKYNDIEKWKLFKDYINSRKSNMISPFTSFDQYYQYKKRIDNEIIGMITSDGLEIKFQSKHFIERVFGTDKDPKTGNPRDGVPLEEIIDALKNGKSRKNNADSIQYRNNSCSVSINPKTGKLIQVNPI